MVKSRDELKEFAIRKNGDPVVHVEITDEQLEDAIDLAFQHTKTPPNEWDNYRLKMATAAFVRLQWGLNLMKYEGVELIGGVKLNPTGLYQTAMQELKDLEG